MQINRRALKMAAVITAVTLVTYFTLNTLFPRKGLHDMDVSPSELQGQHAATQTGHGVAMSFTG